MRAFLAIDIPKKVRQSLEDQIIELKKDYPDITWVSPKNFHITLLYLGDIGDPKEIEKKVEDLIFEIRPFSLFSLGAEILLTEKVTIQVSFYRQKMVEELMEILQNEFNPESHKELIPHVILGKYRVPSKQQYLLLKKKIQNLDIEIEFPVDKIYLYQSVVEGAEPVYKKLSEFILNP